MKFVISRDRFNEGVREQQDRESRINRLARFNSEVGRGILHTPEWAAFMDEEQKWFDSGCPQEESYPIGPGVRVVRSASRTKDVTKSVQTPSEPKA